MYTLLQRNQLLEYLRVSGWVFAIHASVHLSIYLSPHPNVLPSIWTSFLSSLTTRCSADSGQFRVTQQTKIPYFWNTNSGRRVHNCLLLDLILIKINPFETLTLDLSKVRYRYYPLIYAKVCSLVTWDFQTKFDINFSFLTTWTSFISSPKQHYARLQFI